MPNRLIVLFAHPRLEHSRVNQALWKHIPDLPAITTVDLYDLYPDYNIDVVREQELLTQHDIIVWMHPFYWYSAPPLMKQWIDRVLEFGWAYGPGGNALQGKYFLNAITTGGAETAYQPEGHNRYTINEFLRPFEQTVRLCQATYLPPHAVQGTHRLTEDEVQQAAQGFQRLLNQLVHASPDQLQNWATHSNLHSIIH